MIRILSYIGLLVGILILTLLIFWQGFSEIFGLLFKSGFSLLLLPVVWLPILIIAVIGAANKTPIIPQIIPQKIKDKIMVIGCKPKVSPKIFI